MAPMDQPPPGSLLALTEGATSIEEALFLHDLARAVTGGCIVEVGSYRGRSTVALALGSMAGSGAPVYAVDPHEPFTGVYGGRFGPEDRAAFYQAMLATGCYRTVRLVNLSSELVTRTWPLPVALLFIDGDHAYEAVRRDVDCWLPHLAPDARIVFDDAADPAVGPCRVIGELVASGCFERERTFGKMAVVRRR